MIHLDRLCIRKLDIGILGFESIPDQIVLSWCAYTVPPKRLQLIMQGHNFIEIWCGIEAVPYEMKIAIQLLC